jgi:uncharacterized membrane protein
MSDLPARRRYRRSPYASRSGRVLVATTALLALSTLAGLIILWPGGSPHQRASSAMGGPTQPATVTRVVTVDCGGPQPQDCVRVRARLESGRHIGMTLGPAGTVHPPAAGDHVRVQRTGAPAGDEFAFAGVDRRMTLLYVALAFAAMVVVLARVRGVLALAGLAISLLLVTEFVLPAILAGSSALLVALVGSLAVMFVTVILTYGVTPPSLAACLGIAGSLLLAALAGVVTVDAARLDGRSGELSAYLATTNPGVSLQGIVLAGLVIGVLGVLADMGVTQASTVMALRRANPSLGARALFSGAFGVGRDHLVATTHTLVLAYLGASLPLLLSLGASGVSTTDALNSQEVAEPIVATLIGAMALLMSVPLTTALCAAMAHRMPPESIPDRHAHAH